MGVRGGVDIESERRSGVTCRVALITAVYPTEQGPSPSPPLVLPSPSPGPCPSPGPPPVALPPNRSAAAAGDGEVERVGLD